MEILEIKNREKWNKFVADNGSQFLESWDWGDFQASLGRKIWRLAAAKGEHILAGALVIKYSLPFNQNYLYLPRGPIGSNEKLVDRIIEIAMEEKSIFIRMEPSDKLELKVLSSRLQKTKSVQPMNEWRLDLNSTGEELLRAMHPKTRYNVGLAQKHGVTMRKAEKEEFNNFWQLLDETYSKKGLRSHSREYYKKMLDLSSAELYFAEYHGLVLAANLMIFFGNQAIYLHGASSEKHKEVMAPYLLFWETIKDAKNRGLRYYNFGGVAPEGNDEQHPWFGITRFKHGFGGAENNYAGTWDLPINKIRYTIYKMSKKLLR